MTETASKVSRAILASAETYCLAEGGEMGRLMRSFDWSSTPLGPVSSWDRSLQTSLSICLNSRFPMVIWWSQDLFLFYNDAWQPILGSKHPQALGKPGREVCPEIWDIIGTQLKGVLDTGKATWSDDLLLLIDRSGYTEEAYFTYSYSPILTETGQVGGAFTAVNETTERVLGERRLATLRDLAAQAGVVKSVAQAFKSTSEILTENQLDLPFALLYQVNLSNGQAVLDNSIANPSTNPAYRQLLNWMQADWVNLYAALEQGIVEIQDLERFGTLPSGPWKVKINQALILPIQVVGPQLVGVLVVGVNPCRQLDREYRNFFQMTAGYIGSAIANATAYEEQRQQAQALAELNRAKTTFFSNISHEFRTPLTLILSPLEDLLTAANSRFGVTEQEQLKMIQRNGLRLLKLVNTLLDFSRIEAGRVQATYEVTDLAIFTAELASGFRSVIERAGMSLKVECPALPAPIYVDRDMWEKIVLNLLSNAFKFTFAGEIAVALRWENDYVNLTVRDTGTGIPADELPHLFERFYRVEGARGRSYEGSGIGLSLVQELVKLHQGTIDVSSVVDRGTCFTVKIPTGATHLLSNQIGATSLVSTAIGVTPYIEEALRWLPDNYSSLLPTSAIAPNAPTISFGNQDRRFRILLVDDNADMREYMKRLLNQHYEVQAVENGAKALEIARSQPLDLILSDVMMPEVDGFALLHQLRTEPMTRDLPVILLSARAGEARAEGIKAGADDYLIKPFSVPELLTRVAGTLKLAQMRQESIQQEQAARIKVEALAQELAVEGDRLQAEIAERQETESALRKSKERLKIALDAAQLGLWDWNLLTNKLTWTEHHARLWDMPIEAIDGDYAAFEERIHPSDRANITQARNNAISLDGEYECEYRVIWQDGSIHWIAAKGRVLYNDLSQAVRMIGIVRDITPQKQAAQERETLLMDLGTALQKLNFHFENSPLAVIEWDCEFRVNRWSKEAEKIFGWRASEILGKCWSNLQFVHEEDVEQVSEGVARLFAGTSQLKLLNRNYTKDGSIVYCEWYNSALLDESGNLVSVLSLALNVSDRVQLEAERTNILRLEQAARAEAERANRVKDEFLAVLSHELRTPLNPILGWSKLLQMGRLSPAKATEALATIERNARLQTQLIDDLLDVSRILQGKLVLTVDAVNLEFVINAALETVHLAAEAKGIEIQIIVEPDIGSILGDIARLQQVAWNLLSNAVKFTPPKGRVEVKLAQVDGYAQIQVTDTGKGINAEFLPYVFDYFRQADSATTRRFGGLGLGLAIVRQIVELHGGTVRAESSGEEQGATFTVMLPLPAQNLPAINREPIESNDCDLDGVRILVVDDEPDSRDFVAFVLKQAGADVVSVGSAMEALQSLLPQKPDVLISDIGMPEMDGWMLMREIRAIQLKPMPAIALTAYAGEYNQQQALLAGFNLHLVKPIEPQELIAAVSRLIKQTKFA